MLYEITDPEDAPWPPQAKAGDYADMPSIPAWAEGKCQRVPPEAKVSDMKSGCVIYRGEKVFAGGPYSYTADIDASIDPASKRYRFCNVRGEHRA